MYFLGQFGKSLPLCYCMQPSYWKSISRRRRLSPQRVYTEPVENISDCPHIEPVTDDMKNLNKLQLINIKKTYKVSGKNVDAVKGQCIILTHFLIYFTNKLVWVIELMTVYRNQ